MQKCVGLLVVFAVASVAWAGNYDMSASCTPSYGMSYNDVQCRVQMCAPKDCHMRMEKCQDDHYGSCTVNMYEDCDGCNKPRMQQSYCCDMGKNYGPGKYNVCVQHYINPCHNPKCQQCRQFSNRDKPQFCGMTHSCFNICDGMFGQWWSWW
jgi:hypothetical protein